MVLSGCHVAPFQLFWFSGTRNSIFPMMVMADACEHHSQRFWRTVVFVEILNLDLFSMNVAIIPCCINLKSLHHIDSPTLPGSFFGAVRIWREHLIILMKLYVCLICQPRRNDLDMNLHVNNVTYIGWMLEVCFFLPLLWNLSGPCCLIIPGYMNEKMAIMVTFVTLQ